MRRTRSFRGAAGLAEQSEVVPAVRWIAHYFRDVAAMRQAAPVEHVRRCAGTEGWDAQ